VSPWLIDHGAALYFHHTSEDFLERTGDPFPRIRDHVLLPFAGDLSTVDGQMTERITRRAIDGIVTLVPDVWLGRRVRRRAEGCCRGTAATEPGTLRRAG
jgi:hypothetical protein